MSSTDLFAFPYGWVAAAAYGAAVLLFFLVLLAVAAYTGRCSRR